MGLSLFCLSCGRVGFDANTGIDRCFAEPGGASSLTLDNFEVEFATPNTIRLRWESTDPMDEFDQYEVLLIESEQLKCNVRRFDSTTNPGLAHFRGPRVGHQLVATSVDELVPATDYVAQLIVRDQQGEQLASSLLNVRTSDASSEEIVIFAEEDTAGYSIPSELIFATGRAFTGSQYYEYVSVCENGCFENLRRQDVDVSLESMTEEDFGRAYYEFALASSGSDHSYWSQARLSFRQSDVSNILSVYSPFVLEAGDSYSLYQIPLRAFGGDDALTYEIAKLGIFEFTVGGSWPLGETVRLDDVRIRW